jgi:hypothetical protein
MFAPATVGEEAQLFQTIEMFEVITQSQPLDCQSLEILKEAYFKLGRFEEAVATSKRVAEAYMHLGQLSSSILEYEGILQRFPDDPDVHKALAEIEHKASNLAQPDQTADPEERRAAIVPFPAKPMEDRPTEVLDGRETMKKIFVESRQISEVDFDQCWPRPRLSETLKEPVEPFIQVVADRQIMPIEASLKLLIDRSRLCYLPIERYELDVDTSRSFPQDICRRWCILPFDRMSKSILIATANPFNKQAARDLESCIEGRLLWYLATPKEITKTLRKIFR